ncbi:hypothetical protein [Cnuibacter physcomitrellae]|nr:hypothetical protein [Cnuibacter physcomitrellae]
MSGQPLPHTRPRPAAGRGVVLALTVLGGLLLVVLLCRSVLP